MQKILIVADEVKLRNELKYFLETYLSSKNIIKE